MNNIRVAVIGAGRLGGFHAQKISRMDGVELVAVVDPLAANRDRVAAACRTQALASHRTLLDKIDAAVIASPTVLHHALAIDLLESRIHLLVEKPLCANLAEADELVELAQRQQVVLQVGHVERFNPALDAVAPHAKNPRFIETVRTSGFTFRSLDIGVVHDMMIHDIDIVLSLVNSPLKRTEATGITLFGGREDIAHAWLEFESGCVASLSASRVAHDSVRKMHAWAEAALVSVDYAARAATIVRPGKALLRGELQAQDLDAEQIEYYKAHLGDELLPREVQSYEAIDALSLELQDFVESIRTMRQPRVNGAAGRDALAVAEQILACIATRHAAPSTKAFPRIVPAPHFDLSAASRSQSERRAG